MAEIDPEPVVVVEEPKTVAPPVVYSPVPSTPITVVPRKVYGGMWGPTEIVAVSVGALAVFFTILLYAFMVIPSSREVAKNRSEADRLDAELISAKSKYGEITSTEVQVAKLISSVDDFETRFLPLPATGQTSLYQKLNGLIAAYGLVNTTGPDFAPLETADQNPGQQTELEKGRAKFRSLYPGVYVSTTLEGSYQNLRRFIREIETGNEFVVISAVELAPSDTEHQKEIGNPAPPIVATNPARPNPRTMVNPTMGNPPMGNPYAVQNQPTSLPAKPKGKTHGETVSLHIEMAAYFRRPNFVPMSPQ